jgi:undecaprenyl-diphosphatase
MLGMTTAPEARWRAVCLASLGIFVVLALVAGLEGAAPGDTALRHAIVEAQAPLTLELARWVNVGGTFRVIVPVLLMLYVFSPAARRHWWLWAAVFAVTGVVEDGAKSLIARPRPADVSFGFPSGHATAAAALSVILLYVASRERMGRRGRAALGIGAALLSLGVGWARVALSAHWPSDVLGGWALGAACAGAAAWWERAREGRT